MPTATASSADHNRSKDSLIDPIDQPARNAFGLKILDAEIRGLRDVITTRLDSMDMASEVLSENVNRVPTLLDREILRIGQLFDEKYSKLEEKFSSIVTQFKERDIRADKAEIAQKEMSMAQATSAATAVAAALQAQKEAAAAQNASNSEAITKSELSVSEQLKGIQALLASINNALNDKIAVINGRLDRGEGGHVQKEVGNTTFINNAGLIVAVGAVLVSVFAVFQSHAVSPAPAPIAAAAAPYAYPPPYYPPQSQQGVTVSPAFVGKPQ